MEYAGRIFHDIEFGRIKWENLSAGLQPHTFLYAKDTVEMQLSKRGKGRGGDQSKGHDRVHSKSDVRYDDNPESTKVCRSYNGFRTGNGCGFEYDNDRQCGYEHFCSSCFEMNGTKESHKAFYCQPYDLPSSDSNGSGSAKPAVTSG